MTDEQIAEAMGWDVRHLRLSVDSVAHRVCNLVAAAERGRWQPIATAPRDSKPVLIYEPGARGGVFKAHLCRMMDRKEAWIVHGALHPMHPTHWMPLPAPPAP